ncbi:hypothetical protein [Novibacillus thermophilus]|uniref:hypothetical protein n=1 Tax=Novibacillus thermophilus TaxID=1471761 RepID=UPI0014762BED|nr:hypothetical protein [Novibacillus thermophilus]
MFKMFVLVEFTVTKSASTRNAASAWNASTTREAASTVTVVSATQLITSSLSRYY